MWSLCKDRSLGLLLCEGQGEAKQVCHYRGGAESRPIATKITQRDLRELSHLGHDGPVGAEAPSSSLRESLPSFFSQAPDTFSEHMPIAINLRPRRPLDQLQDLIADWSSKNGQHHPLNNLDDIC